MIFTRATPVGGPSINLPFRQYIYLSFYLSRRVWENYPEVIVFSFAKKAFDQNFKRLSNQALLRLKRVSNSFFKFSEIFLPMNFSLRRSKNAQVNDGHMATVWVNSLHQCSCQFNTALRDVLLQLFRNFRMGIFFLVITASIVQKLERLLCFTFGWEQVYGELFVIGELSNNA